MNEIDFKRIGTRLKEIRLANNLTQEYVAHASDVNVSHISNIENNRVKVSLTTLIHICNAMNTTVDYILFHDYEEPLSVLDRTILLELKDCDTSKKETILKIIRALK